MYFVFCCEDLPDSFKQSVNHICQNHKINLRKKASSISTFEFSILYTNINYKLKYFTGINQFLL